jgi:hypothetical protein
MPAKLRTIQVNVDADSFTEGLREAMKSLNLPTNKVKDDTHPHEVIGSLVAETPHKTFRLAESAAGPHKNFSFSFDKLED